MTAPDGDSAAEAERRRELQRQALAVARADRARHFAAQKPAAGRVPLKLQRVGVPCPAGDGPRLRRFLERLGQLVDVLSSPEVPPEIYERRMASCHACEHCSITSNNEHYCACCRCPKWRLFGEGSALEYKCRHAAWACPRPSPAYGAYEVTSL